MVEHAAARVYRPALVLIFFLSFVSCTAAAQSGAELYEGLKKRQEGAQSEAVACFEKALNADNPSIAAAAAAALLSMRADEIELSEAAMALIRRKATGTWALALEAADKEKFHSLLFNGSLDEAALYALKQWHPDKPAGMADDADDGSSRGIADFTEIAAAMAMGGRLAASRSRYNEALLPFRVALRDLPDLFFRYPDLITDLGRTFQYATATGREGIELFLKWEKELKPADNENLIRFRLLFFAARIARQRGDKNNIELFERALPFAHEVSPEQSDACIWYILDSSLSQSPAAMIRYLEKYILQWHDGAYFTDVLDKLARELILKRQWEDMIYVCAILRNRPGPATAKYAWIISRALEEGLFPPENPAAKRPPPRSAAAYQRIAYDAGMGSLYYRSLSAAALGESFLVLPVTAPQAASQPPEEPSPDMEFLLGFFKHNAAVFAPRYIKPLENDLSADELRRLAAALGETGQYQESMRLVTLYSRRDGYQMTRQDWELLYPCPFKELVERYAGETGIEPALLFALMRTESAFDPAIISRAGAVGLTQLMPATAREMAVRIRRQGGPDYVPDGGLAIDLRDPAVNIHIGAAYLAYLNERMEDPLLALLAYNGGMNRIRRWRRTANVPPPDLFLETIEYVETRNYGRSVRGAAAMYTELYYSNLEKPKETM